MTLETYVNGWDKIHRECGGLVRFIEHLGPGLGWDLECTECGLLLAEEDVEFRRR